MILASRIRESVADFVSGKVDADSFVSNFSELSYNIHKTGSEEAISFSYRIESALADVYSGHKSADALRRSLGDCVEREKIPA